MNQYSSPAGLTIGWNLPTSNNAQTHPDVTVVGPSAPGSAWAGGGASQIGFNVGPAPANDPQSSLYQSSSTYDSLLMPQRPSAPPSSVSANRARSFNLPKKPPRPAPPTIISQNSDCDDPMSHRTSYLKPANNGIYRANSDITSCEFATICLFVLWFHVCSFLCPETLLRFHLVLTLTDNTETIAWSFNEQLSMTSSCESVICFSVIE